MTYYYALKYNVHEPHIAKKYMLIQLEETVRSTLIKLMIELVKKAFHLPRKYRLYI